MRGPDDPCLAILRQRRERCGMRCVPIPLEAARRWALADGALRHDTGGFFSVIGVRGSISARGRSAAGAPRSAPRLVEQPLIDQPEIGILGILLRMRSGRAEILVQAKAEPGNVNGVQLSPTVQATESNYRRLHGGAPTAYLDHFTRGGPWAVLTDSRQSEQGTRFLGKYNRNVTVLVNGDGPEPVSDCWRWCAAASVLRALARDFAVNTDLRSVLATSDWSALAGGGIPFAAWRGRGGWGEALLDSYLAEGGTEGDAPGAAVRDLVEFRRSIDLDLGRVPLQRLAGWRLDGGGLRDLSARGFEVTGFRVHAPDREVPAWDQPLIRDRDEGAVILVAQRRNGILRFLLRPRLEIGFREKAQYAPSWQKPEDRDTLATVPGDPIDQTLPLLLSAGQGMERLSCLLSEEGGRFYRSTSRYRVIELAEGVRLPLSPGSRFLTLAEIRRLLALPGLLNNEARSAVALLLSFLPGPSLADSPTGAAARPSCGSFEPAPS